MVSRSFEWVPQSPENPFPIMSYRAGFAMAKPFRLDYLSSERVNDPLVA
jgi:hypothetical protein